MLSKKFGSFQTNFTLNFYKEIKSKEVNKKVISASALGPMLIEGREGEEGSQSMFNVSASWKQFARLGRLSSPIIVPGDSVLACETGCESGVGAAGNILYVKGIWDCQ